MPDIESLKSILCAALQPSELLLPVGNNFLSAEAHKLLLGSSSNPRKNYLPVGDRGFLSPFLTVNRLEQFYAPRNRPTCQAHSSHQTSNGSLSSKPVMPADLENLLEDPDKNIAVLHALGGILEFLKSSLMDESVIPLAKFERLDTVDESHEQNLQVCEGFHKDNGFIFIAFQLMFCFCTE